MTRNEETLEPPDFASRAWPAYLACIEKQGYYFLVEELLALATIAQINILVFTSIGSTLNFVGGNFTGTSPFVFIKLAANRFGRIRSHFERFIPKAEFDILVSEFERVSAMRSVETDRKRGNRTDTKRISS